MNPIIGTILFIFLQFISIRIIFSGCRSIIKLNNLKKTEVVKLEAYIFPIIVICGGLFYTICHLYKYLK
jgi:hypothetical protein